jgi:cytochrome c-type biogenesis protein CcmE
VTIDKTRIRLFVGLGLIFAAFGYLFFSQIESSQVYYMTVDEYQDIAATLAPDEAFRVSGRVEPDSVVLAKNGIDLQFTVYDPESADATLAVSYHGVVPDTFLENSEVVVEGTLHGEVFKAHTLLAKCPSKYEGLEDDLANEETAREAEAAGHPAGSDT